MKLKYTQTRLSYLYATGLILSVSQMILNSRQRNSGFVLGLIKCAMMSFSLDMEVQLRYSSSTDFFNWCLFSAGWLFCVKYSFNAGGKHAKVWTGQEWGVCCIMFVKKSLHQPANSSPPPCTCIERARVRMSTRFSSSLSLEATLPGDLSFK